MVSERIREMNGRPCSCGVVHRYGGETIAGVGVVKELLGVLKKLSIKKPYIVCDVNTYKVAAKQIEEILKSGNVDYKTYTFQNEHLNPNEASVGSAFMHFDKSCDGILAVGSGVINDICKILAHHTALPYVIVATAPSMDGYQSMTSSMSMDGVKVSLPSRAADVVIGDVDILKTAPLRMLLSGVGDMLAKYVSICEWRISNLITGEFYCEEIAELIRYALKKIVENADKLLEGDPDAILAVFDGLSAGSIAMNYAGLSRPASGLEHSISHIFDMRAEECGESTDFHGIQCAIGTLLTVGMYEKLLTITPDKAKALSKIKSFDKEAWRNELNEFLGIAAKSMIALEEKERKYDSDKLTAQLNVITEHFGEIKDIVKAELLSYESLLSFMKKIGLPTSFEEIGLGDVSLKRVIRATVDIRDKFILSKLLFVIGELDEFTEEL